MKKKKEDKIKAMVELKKDGLSYRKIGKMFGVSGQAVYSRIGWAIDKPKKPKNIFVRLANAINGIRRYQFNNI